MVYLAASAYENLEWINELVKYTAFIAKEKPHIKLIGTFDLLIHHRSLLDGKLGICFGHQIISRALGEECVPNNGRWEVGLTTLQLTDVGKKIFGVESLVYCIVCLSGPICSCGLLTEHSTNASRSYTQTSRILRASRLD